MAEALEREEKLKIPGFGIFKVREKAARKGGRIHQGVTSTA
jgi:nucleoid DNA-binding protein